MHKIFMSSGCYIQGPGSLDLVAEKTATLGSQAALICDAALSGSIGARLMRNFERQNLRATAHVFSGEVTHPAIERLTAQVRAAGGDVIVGAGGGKALDAAKGVARRLDIPFVSVPTIASTDAPASRGLVVYDDAHRMVVVEQLARNPDFVIADTEVIAKAPARFMRAGIGDAISKKFEADGCWAGRGVTKQGTRPSYSGKLMGEICYRTVREHGVAAIRAAEKGAVTDSLEHVIEAAVLLSCLAFENGGLSIAHALAPPLGVARGAGEALHGEHVAYATLVQMTVENRPDSEIDDLIGFLREVGLPCSLGDLGMSGPTPAEIEALATGCAASPHVRNQAREVGAAEIRRGIEDVEKRAARFART
jgi:glycerol dehydrogenase